MEFLSLYFYGNFTDKALINKGIASRLRKAFCIRSMWIIKFSRLTSVSFGHSTYFRCATTTV